MAFLPFTRMWERVDIARDDSDMAYFMNLMYMGELFTKCVVAGITAAIVEDRQRNRYSAVYQLVRANGLGDWSKVLDDILTGPAAQSMLNLSADSQRELTQRVGESAWQYEAVALLNKCLVSFDIQKEKLTTKVDGRRWFSYFVQLRNQTRAHGAPQSGKCSIICSQLEESLKIFIDNYSLFKLPWAFLHRNFSGKYRVTKLTDTIDPFEYLKKTSLKGLPNFPDGVYVHFDKPALVELISSDPDAFDFFLPNGQFTNRKFELMSYITEVKIEGDSSSYLLPATELPASETQGRGLLEILGNSWVNLPPEQKGYISRPTLEQDLIFSLKDDRHPIVTLVGRGGIGKTWLALNVLHKVTKENRFEAILWFSARDIDLLSYGPKKVRPQVLDEKDIAHEFARLIQPSEYDTKGFDAVEFLAENLGKSRIGPFLLVFDNFETVKNPVELYTWIDTYLRLPNKVLITTRFREFKADYPVEVGGMNEDEVEALIQTSAIQLNIENLLTQSYKNEVFQESEGHPYVIKILLGEVSKARRLVRIERIFADSDEVLKALFERTYTGFSPATKRLFLTLCNWRSIILQIALEAVFLRPENEKIDVRTAIDELVRSSFIEQYTSDNDQEVFLGVPLVTALFGKKKLAVSPMKSAIEADTQLLRAFGAIQESDIPSGIDPRVKNLFKYVAQHMTYKGENLGNFIPILEFVSRKYPKGWLYLASLYEESGEEDRLEKAKSAVQHYLETPQEKELKRAWKSFSIYCRRTNDSLGEAHALVEMSQLPDASLEEISESANRINLLLNIQQLLIDSDEKQILIKKLITVFKKKIKEGDATDYSRIAWLAMHVQDKVSAKEFAEKGLFLDPHNQHIQKLSSILNIY